MFFWVCEEMRLSPLRRSSSVGRSIHIHFAQSLNHLTIDHSLNLLGSVELCLTKAVKSDLIQHMDIDELRIHHLELLKKFIIRYDFDRNAYSFKEINEHLGKMRVLRYFSNLLPGNWTIAQRLVAPSLEERAKGKDWPLTAESMIGLDRMNQFHEALDTVRLEKIEGDIVETGIWRGGAIIFAASYLKVYGLSSKKVFGCDSFEGLPKPDPDYPIDAGDIHHTINILGVSLPEVVSNLVKYGVDPQDVKLVKGWFKDTLPQLDVEAISILRLDGDMYSSTIQSLNALYHKVTNGGYVIIDDWCLEGARKALEDFFSPKSLPIIIDIDGTGAYFRKADDA